MKKLAIDFGTSNSLVCLVDGKKVSPPLALDHEATDPVVFRSVLYMTPKETFYGARAVKQFLEDELSGGVEGRLLRSIKRFLPQRTFGGTQIGSKKIQLEEMVASFLGELRRRTLKLTGEDVRAAILGRPALFSEDPELDQLAQARLERAAKIAGFEKVEFLPEPVAAAFRYRNDRGHQREETVLVADFGGGTSDYTVMKMGARDFRPDDVLAIGGVPVAGDALDGEIMRHRVSRQFGAQVQYQVPFGSNVLTMPRLLMENLCSTAHIPLLSRRDNADFLDRVKKASLGKDDHRVMEQLETLISDQLGFPVFEAIEGCKRGLSASETSAVDFSYPGVTFKEPIDRAQFIQYTDASFSKILKALDSTLTEAGLDYSGIDRVCCTGGTARVKVLRDELVKRFGEAKIEEYRHFTSIVEGLGAWALSGKT
ncbi:MAG: Hsp70 family protein [Bdellovibrionales bacterium]|nr:Hsp70 family protein [Bdellovibrionales bacterium]